MTKPKSKREEDVLKKNENKFMKDIVSGKYKSYYLIYNRKSTDEAENQKNSISYQKSENSQFAIREFLPIASVTIKGFCREGVISEKHSGFKEDDTISFTKNGLVQYSIDRPKFQKLLQMLNKGYFKGIVCLSWDRISRNKGDDTLIRKLMRRGIDIRFVYAKYDKTSSGALHMDIDGMFSQHHSRVTSEKVALSTKNNREKGICTYRAPIGYLNLGGMDNKPLDPERAPIIKEMFKLYGKGKWSLSGLANYANERGMSTMPMRRRRTQEELLDEDLELKDIPKISRPITENNVSRILGNLFYTGRVKGNNGNYIKSISHKALVTDKTFNTVQLLLKKNTISVHYVDKLKLPLRGVIRCTECNRVYTPYIKKGIHYYNARCKKDCTNTLKNFNFKYITDKIEKKIRTLYFTDEELINLTVYLGTEISLFEERRAEEIKQIERKKRKKREDLKYLRSNKLSFLRTEVYTPEDYANEEDKLNNELIELQGQEEISDQAMHDTMKEVIKISELLKRVTEYYGFGNTNEKEYIINILFSELFISDKTLKYKLHRGIDCLSERFHAVCDPTAWLSELYADIEYIKTSIKDLDSVLKKN